MPVHEALPTWVTVDEQVAMVDGAVVGAAQDDEIPQRMVATARSEAPVVHVDPDRGATAGDLAAAVRAPRAKPSRLHPG